MAHLSGQHFLISGKVQNVFYRRFCQTAALKLNLTGWAKNLADGCVEVSVYGDTEALAQFEKQLWKGPILADVTNVIKKDVMFQAYKDFNIL